MINSALHGKKHIVIISDNSIVHSALIENSAYDIELVDRDNYQDYFNNVSKIDLLIIDTEIAQGIIDLYKVNFVINLTSQKILENEVVFCKPFKLEKVLSSIAKSVQDKHIFCCINNHWVYNQFLAKISSVDQEINLTSKENDIFMALLCSENFSASKGFLKHEIWNYHQDSVTTTVDIHLYKLKNKLPDGFLVIRSSDCQLNVDQLL